MPLGTFFVFARDMQGALATCPLYRLRWSKDGQNNLTITSCYRGEVSSGPDFGGYL